MRKIFIMILMFVGLLSGCKNKEVRKDDVVKYLEKLESYSLVCDMSMKKNNQDINMEISVDYVKPDYYKVGFGNDMKQVIVKNEKGVFVITPNLNKEFKFDGSWPNNNPSVYLLNSVCNAIKDKDVTITSSENEITLECEITHKTNSKITKMKYICDKKYTPLKIVFCGVDNKEIVVGVIKNFKANPTITLDNFSEEKYLKKDLPEKENTTSLILEAGYTIEGNQLESSVNEETSTILCYKGDKPYTIVVNKVNIYPEVVVMEEYSEVVVLNDGLGFVKENSLRFFHDDYEVTIYSDYLSIEEFEAISMNLSFA